MFVDYRDVMVERGFSFRFDVRSTFERSLKIRGSTIIALSMSRYAITAMRTTQRKSIHRNMRSMEWKPGGNRHRFPEE